MKLKTMIYGVVTLFYATICVVSAAMASDVVTEYTIGLREHFPELVMTVLLAIGSFIMFVLNRVSSLIGLKRDAEIRQYLDQAIFHGLAYAQENIISKYSDINDLTTRTKLVAEASNYVLEKVPDAIAHFNLGNKDLQDMLFARLNQVNQNAVSNVEVE